MSDLVSSGIFVVEGLSGGQPIAARRETVAAFIGKASRGPVNIPVAVRSGDEYFRRFGCPNKTSALQNALKQFFENGGTKAIVIRVSRTDRHNQISLPGPAGALTLEAVNPGPLEYLRASIDLDNIPDSDNGHFNLVIHRVASPDKPFVEEQEIFHALSMDPEHPDFIVDALLNSNLMHVHGTPPSERPERTLGPSAERQPAYIYADSDWHSADIPTDYDLIGSDTDGTGLYALEQIPVVDLLCIAPGSRDYELGPLVLFAAERYCRRRNALLLIDPPAHWTSVTKAVASQREHGFSSPNVLTYFPHPATLTGEDTDSESILGAVAGQLASGDAKRGTWRSLEHDPVLRCRTHLSCKLTDAESAILARSGINSLRQVGSGRLLLSGLVTLAKCGGLATEWNDLGKRRLALFIIDSIIRGTRWAAFNDNNENTWADVRRQVREFLQVLFEEGALAGSDPRRAFYVICDADTNADSLNISDTLSFIAGFALHRPGEFLAFRFLHDQFECKIRAISWQPGLALAS